MYFQCKWFIYVTASALFTPVTLANDINLSNVNQSPEKVVNTVVNNIFNKTQLAFNDVMGLFNEKCLENNAAAAKETIISAYRAKEDLKRCVTSHFNATLVIHEIQTAPVGQLDTVFKRYCDKRTILRQCITDFIATVQDCMNEGILETTRNACHVAETLIDFICIKEGDLIAQFYADKGPECIKSKYDYIYKYCYSDTIAKYIPKKLFPLPNFKLEWKECTELATFWRCSVESLELCEDSAAANVVGAMCQTFWELTPCYKAVDPLEYYPNLYKPPQIMTTSSLNPTLTNKTDVTSDVSKLSMVNEDDEYIIQEVYPDIRSCAVLHNIRIDALSIVVVFSFVILSLIVIILIFTLAYYRKLNQLHLDKSKERNFVYIHSDHRRKHSALF